MRLRGGRRGWVDGHRSCCREFFASREDDQAAAPAWALGTWRSRSCGDGPTLNCRSGWHAGGGCVDAWRSGLGMRSSAVQEDLGLALLGSLTHARSERVDVDCAWMSQLAKPRRQSAPASRVRCREAACRQRRQPAVMDSSTATCCPSWPAAPELAEVRCRDPGAGGDREEPRALGSADACIAEGGASPWPGAAGVLTVTVDPHATSPSDHRVRLAADHCRTEGRDQGVECLAWPPNGREKWRLHCHSLRWKAPAMVKRADSFAWGFTYLDVSGAAPHFLHDLA
jgi:hypothetical protein